VASSRNANACIFGFLQFSTKHAYLFIIHKVYLQLFQEKMVWIELEAKAFFCIYMIAIMSIGTGALLLDKSITREELIFVDFHFFEKYDYISCEFRNIGTTNIIIEEALLNYQPYFRFVDPMYSIPVGESRGVTFVHEWKSGWPYTITLVTKTGKVFHITEDAPQRHLPLEVEEIVWNSTDSAISMVVSNIDELEQNISGLGLSDSPNDGYRHFDSSEIRSPNVSIIGSKWDWRITILAGQTTTIVLDWPYRDPWTSGKTYFFFLYSESGPNVDFNSKAP